MESKSLELNLKKIKLKSFKFYLFCQYSNKDYLVLLTEEQEIYLLAVSGFEIEVSAQVKATFKQPIGLINGQDGEICLLTKDYILIWTISQLIQSKSQAFMLNIVSQTSPERAWYIGKDEFMVSYPNNNLLFISKSGRSYLTKYPDILDIKSAKTSMHSSNPQRSIIIIPTFSLRLPLIFTLQQLQLWKRSNFLPSYLSTVKRYYEDDELLTDRISSFCVSSNRMEVYVCTLKSIMLLTIKKIPINPDKEYNYHVFSIKLVVKYPKERCSELSSAIDEKTGYFTTLGHDRIVLFDLHLIKSSGRCIVQKKNHESIVQDLSYLRDGKLILLCHGPKMFIWQQLWSS